jgi:hypothetical protein
MSITQDDTGQPFAVGKQYAQNCGDACKLRREYKKSTIGNSRSNPPFIFEIGKAVKEEHSYKTSREQYLRLELGKNESH